jgi:hypothetical protein
MGDDLARAIQETDQDQVGGAEPQVVSEGGVLGTGEAELDGVVRRDVVIDDQPTLIVGDDGFAALDAEAYQIRWTSSRCATLFSAGELARAADSG